MKKVVINNYGDWLAVFCLPSIFGVSRATIYRSIKACNIPIISLYGIISVVMSRELYRFYHTKWFKRYIKQLRESGLINIKPIRNDYVSAYADVPEEVIKRWLHPPKDIISNELLEVSSQQLRDLVDSGLVPTVDIDNQTYCLPWWYDYLENMRYKK